jgi:hypothetical protein
MTKPTQSIPWRSAPGISKNDLEQAFRNGPAFLDRDWREGLTRILEIQGPKGAAEVVVNRHRACAFFEAWSGDDFSEPHYDLGSVLACAQEMSTESP